MTTPETPIKFCPAMRTFEGQEIDLTPYQYFEMVSNMEEKKKYPDYHEAILGKVVPYYDFDNKYSDQKSQKAAADSDFAKAEIALNKLFPSLGRRFKWWISNGESIDEEGKHWWKNSYHVIVRGVGHYAQGYDIPRPYKKEAEQSGMDIGIYCHAGKRKNFRAPGASKPGENRPFNRYYNGNEYTPSEWDIEMGNANEMWEENFAQCILDEPLQPCAFEPESKSHGEYKTDGPPLPMVRWNGVDEKLIIHMVTMLKAERAKDRNDWLAGLCAIKGAGYEYGFDAEELAVQFSMKWPEKFTLKGFNTTWKSLREKKFANDGCSGFAWIHKYARIDAPEEYAKLCTNIQEPVRPAKIGYWQDMVELNVKPGLTRDDVEDWMCSCIYIVMNKSRPTFALRMMDGEYTLNSNPFDRVADYQLVTAKTVKGEAKSDRIMYSQILQSLKVKPKFKANIFKGVMEFKPYPPDEEREQKGPNFNIFNGWAIKPMYNDNHPGLQLHLAHFREVICNDCPITFKYWLDNLTCMFKHPDRKIGIMINLLGGQGWGKNRATALLELIYGATMYIELNSMDALLQQFNAFQEKALFCVLDEVDAFGGNHKQANQLKTVSTSKKKLVQYKFQEAYMIDSYTNYILLSNEDWITRVENDDRRYAIFEVSKKYKGNKGYFDRLSAAVTPETAAHLLGFLLRRDISDWDPQVMPPSAKRMENKERSLRVPHRFLLDIAKCQTDIPYLDTGEEIALKTIDFFNMFNDWRQPTNKNEKWGGNQIGFSADIRKVLGDKEVGKTVRFMENDVEVRRSGICFTRTFLRGKLRDFMEAPNYQFE